ALPNYRAVRDLRIDAVSRQRAKMMDDTMRFIDNALSRIQISDTDALIPTIVEAYGFGATLGEVSESIRKATMKSESIQPLTSIRLASNYESMRDAAAAYAKKNGTAPTIFLCNLGPLRRHKIRADFAKGFFEAGGFQIVLPKGFEAPEEAVEALKASSAGIAVVCGTDADYEEHFGSYAKALKEAFPDLLLVLAGFPGKNEEAFRAAGMDDYIFIKSNNYEVNHRYLQGLGVL
ncbi:MAG: hypothetical protein AAGC73_05025, partial [Verrucomicrobiota bacterium]